MRMPGQTQRGLGLVELMVAMVLSLFLVAGVITVFVGTKESYNAQQAMAALQENERLAASVLADTIQQAGYFPYGQTTQTNLAAFPAAGSFKTAGQVIYGTNNTIMVRYVAGPYVAGSNDAIINCNGGTNASSQQVTYVNAFDLDMGKAELQCAVNSGSAQPIVSPLSSQALNPTGGGISGWQVEYGIATQSGNSVEQYLTASQVTAQNAWMQVRSVVITLNFVNPLYNPNQPAGQPQTLTMTRVIGLENLQQ
ncbi:hypothetical protein BJI67_15470 [Acidihalobacter aeolianus]|uniref:Uncharacterized protein n=1 Tax=Acidihalobacter aeolianus TaxID=2792603 RepID=A0A1D8KBE8_9GAMM|nr:PilW family protein [Acidihalobacter aeolianus]AOV18274.1 hypothetical protein BJI67_15470 [Acidihalobacter aeolianus]